MSVKRQILFSLTAALAISLMGPSVGFAMDEGGNGEEEIIKKNNVHKLKVVIPKRDNNNTKKVDDNVNAKNSEVMVKTPETSVLNQEDEEEEQIDLTEDVF